ncbi:alkyl sulfatase C-terminal domain-containing protein [Cupriavidus basilensis]
MRHAKPDVTVTMSKATLDRISLSQVTLPVAVEAGDIKVEGDGQKLADPDRHADHLRSRLQRGYADCEALSVVPHERAWRYVNDK